jgi:hypothetical protein
MTAIPKKKKKRAPSIPTLRAKLDKVFSEWVRRRTADEGGTVQCVACGTLKHWKDMHAGHFVSRKSTATRYDPRNVNPECPGCNTFSQDHLIGYTLWMRKTYGDAVVTELWSKKHAPVKMARYDYERLIYFYRERLATLNAGYTEESPTDLWVRENIG